MDKRERSKHWLFDGGSPAARRVLYPTAILAACALLWGGFVYEADPDVASLLGSADILVRVGDVDAAEPLCDEVLAREPENLHAWLIRGCIAERRQRLDEALAIYERALPLVTDAAIRRDVRLSMADILRRCARLDEALLLLDDVERADAGAAGAVARMRGMVALDRNDLEGALAQFRRFEEVEEDSFEASALVADVLIKLDRPDEARDVLSSVPPDERAAWPVWEALARSCLVAGDHAGAVDALARLLERDLRARERIQSDEFWVAHAAEVSLEGVLE